MNKKTEFRIEQDHSGEVQIPSTAYWGIRTARSNFYISGHRPHPRLIDASMHLKKAAALTNIELGHLDKNIGQAIAQAADEILNGQWRDQLVVDPFQCGAGIAHNHNVNEVLANRGSEILGGTVGTYTEINPDTHVNLLQSPNDVFPTEMRIAVLLTLKDLEPVLLDLERLLRRKSLEFDKVVKPARVRLQDSVPVTLGQEFNAFGSAIQHGYQKLHQASLSLYELNLGAGLVGTGLGSNHSFATQTIDRMVQFTGLKVKPSDDYFRLAQSLADFMQFSSSLKELAVELIKISNDLRLLSSGPNAGIAEITLPNHHMAPASTIDSVLTINVPALTECLSMVAYQIVGNDTSVMLAAQSGQLELNIMTPIVIHNILESMELLKNVLLPFNQTCVTSIKANVDRCVQSLNHSGAIALVLGAHIGSEAAAEIARESFETGQSIQQLVLDKRLLEPTALDKLLNYRSMTQPAMSPDTTGSGTST